MPLLDHFSCKNAYSNFQLLLTGGPGGIIGGHPGKKGPGPSDRLPSFWRENRLSFCVVQYKNYLSDKLANRLAMLNTAFQNKTDSDREV